MLWNLSECTCKAPLAQPSPEREGYLHTLLDPFFQLQELERVHRKYSEGNEGSGRFFSRKDWAISWQRNQHNIAPAPWSGALSVPWAFTSLHSHVQSPVFQLSLLKARGNLFFLE